VNGSIYTRYWILGLFCLVFSIRAGYAQEATRADQPAPDSVEEMKGPLHEGFRRVLRKEPLPRFFSDAQLVLCARSYYFDRDDPSFRDSDALAQGTALAYRSGWLRDRFSIGADVYSSLQVAGENESRLRGLILVTCPPMSISRRWICGSHRRLSIPRQVGWIRLRGSILDRQVEDDVEQFRVIVNYDVPVF
jgi:hypothetical protein